jgi:hypothetical protein
MLHSSYAAFTSDTHNNINFVRELIAHKILLNLTSWSTKTSPPLLYPTMIYPLWPCYAAALEQDAVPTEHRHDFDVVFVHGLRGSVFRTWRQDDRLETFDVNEDNDDDDDDENTRQDVDMDDESRTRCWARDWLPHDVVMSSESTRMRVLGVDYDSVYSLWGQELVDEKKLNLSIKKRALKLAEQLRTAKVSPIGIKLAIWLDSW